MTLVSENIRRMRIFAGVPLRGWGRQMTVRLSMTAIFGNLGGRWLLLWKHWREGQQYYMAIYLLAQIFSTLVRVPCNILAYFICFTDFRHNVLLLCY